MKWQMLLLVGAGLAIAADAGKEETAKQDAEKLRGSWTVVSSERDGKKSDQVNGDKLFLEKDNFTIKTKNSEMKGTWKIDVKAKPKTIDMTNTEGPEKDKTMEAIYTLEGDDLKICFGDPTGKQRPTEFVTKPGTRMFLVVLKRDKP